MLDVESCRRRQLHLGSNFSHQNGLQNLPPNWGLENANKKETNRIHESVAPNWEPKLTSKRGVDIAAFWAEALAGLARFAKVHFVAISMMLGMEKQSESFLYIATYSGGTLTWSSSAFS